MKEAIHIKNIGPIVDFRIDDIKPFIAIIGPSASGKSTFMKILSLMRYIFKMTNIRSYLRHANITKSPFRLHFNSLLHDGLASMFSPQSEIQYTVTINGNSYSISYKDKKLSSLPLVGKDDLSFFKEVFISETRSSIPTWSAQISKARGAQLSYYFHETFKDFDQATNNVKEQNLDFINMKLQVHRSGSSPKKFLILVEDQKNKPIELRHASSGIQTATPLLAMVRYFSKDFSFRDAFQRSALNYLYDKDLISKFSPNVELSEIRKVAHLHIEEPELSLDPEAQRSLVNAIVKEAFHSKANDRDVQLMIATHSPYIINHLNVLLRADYYEDAKRKYPYLSQNKVQAYRIDDGRLFSLLSTDNASGQYVIDTYDMAETIDDIMNEYESMDQL